MHYRGQTGADPVTALAKAKLSAVFALASREGISIGFFIKCARVAEQFLAYSAFFCDRFATLNEF